MIIAYTYHGLVKKIGGVPRYFYENIIRIKNTHQVKIFMRFVTNMYFANILTGKPFPLDKYKIPGKDKFRRFLENINLFFSLKFKDYDIVHHTRESRTVLKWAKSPVVITIHDMTPELYYKEDKKRIRTRKYIIHKADLVICVSENTKKDLLKIYPDVDERKLCVIYHGFNPFTGTYSQIFDKPYLLYVGARSSEYKNFLGMLRAIADTLKSRNLNLVCTGAAFSKSESAEIASLGLTDRMIPAGYVDDNTLASLYHGAECFIYPSMHEGFGLPILEAFANQCPACVSDTSCFPEIGGDAVAYFNPSDAKSMAESIENVLDHPDLRAEMIAKGKERLKLFSWDEAAEKTIEAYKKVLGN